MELANIELNNLSVSAQNMRHGKRAPDISDILPSVRKRGVLVPMLVRPNGSPTSFEIVAGRRRFFAAQAVRAEGGSIGPLPCAILQEGDDADALEASLIENIHRLDPDDMSQFETFAKLIRGGKTPEDIAATFGLTPRQVHQRMALGNLLPKIREAYRREDIDAETVRHLTMATKKQQQEWLKLYENESQSAPTGHQLKQWLFGGATLATSVALFPIADYPGLMVADLFGDNSYFQDADLFWEMQNEVIAARRDAYLAAGWPEVVILDQGQLFESWAHEKTPKKKGGKVFVAVSQRGEVTFHEGYLSRKEARRKTAPEVGASKAESGPATAPEVSAALQTYIDCHRHLAVRAAVLERPGVALRLIAAHAMCGSRLWKVTPEPQRAGRNETDASVQASPSQIAFIARKKETLALLDLPEEAGLTACHADSPAAIFARLLTLSDGDVRRVLTVIMADSLEAGGELVEAAGVHLGVDMAKTWTPDDAFFELVRDKAVVSAMVAEVAGKSVANANVSATGKVQKQIIRDCLTGTNGRVKVEGWLPRWMQFPVRSYRKDSGLKTLDIWKRMKRHLGG
ncbi:MAG: ParB/RepB/Spo0J family partition protein [Rhodospirillaceae bacterium]|nr:ParB/RepB/Spo0J family partition protein [Rhodospirillaceae bacterium]